MGHIIQEILVCIFLINKFWVEFFEHIRQISWILWACSGRILVGKSMEIPHIFWTTLVQSWAAFLGHSWKEISVSIPKTRCEKNCFLENLSLGTEFLGGYSLGKQCWVVGETSATREALPEQISKTSWRHLGGVVRGFCGVWAVFAKMCEDSWSNLRWIPRRFYGNSFWTSWESYSTSSGGMGQFLGFLGEESLGRPCKVFAACQTIPNDC